MYAHDALQLATTVGTKICVGLLIYKIIIYYMRLKKQLVSLQIQKYQFSDRK